MIWDECDGDIIFMVLDGDYSRFDKIYINQYTKDESKEELVDELCDLIYDKDGNRKLKSTDTFPVEQIDQNIIVIVCGYLP